MFKFYSLHCSYFDQRGAVTVHVTWEGLCSIQNPTIDFVMTITGVKFTAVKSEPCTSWPKCYCTRKYHWRGLSVIPAAFRSNDGSFTEFGYAFQLTADMPVYSTLYLRPPKRKWLKFTSSYGVPLSSSQTFHPKSVYDYDDPVKHNDITPLTRENKNAFRNG